MCRSCLPQRWRSRAGDSAHTAASESIRIRPINGEKRCTSPFKHPASTSRRGGDSSHLPVNVHSPCCLNGWSRIWLAHHSVVAHRCRHATEGMSQQPFTGRLLSVQHMISARQSPFHMALHLHHQTQEAAAHRRKVSSWRPPPHRPLREAKAWERKAWRRVGSWQGRPC